VRAEVSNCMQFGTPDFKLCNKEYIKRGVSLSSSLDSLLDEELRVGEDELPIDSLVYIIKKSSSRKSTRKKKTYSS
jgi:hypothetical protein